jgi:membrane-associated phospholipid phosphatase
MSRILNPRSLTTAFLVCFVLHGTCSLAATRAAEADTVLSAPYSSLFEPAPLAPGDEAPDAETLQRVSFDVQEAPKPPQPKHTGLAALVYSTASDFKSFPQRPSTYVILAIGGAAALAVHPADDDINDELQETRWLRNSLKPGKYLGSTPVQLALSIGTYVVGRTLVKPEEGRTNKVSHIGFDLLRAQILSSALTYGVKVAVRRDRPTGECCSLPSGHASITFAAASVLERHFGYRGAWPTWVIAGYVATSRLTDNRHFASDVLFGAALGVASGWTVVGRHGREDFALLPVAKRGGGGFLVMWRPGSARSAG